MLLTRFRAVIPSRHIVLTVAFSSVLGGTVAIGISTWLHAPARPVSNPQPSHDPRFVLLGRAYLPELGKAYAVAWDGLGPPAKSGSTTPSSPSPPRLSMVVLPFANIQRM